MTTAEIKKVLEDFNLSPLQKEIARRFCAEVNAMQGQWLISMTKDGSASFADAHKGTDAGLVMAALVSMKATELDDGNPRP
jgi:hypothetical protein